MAPTIILIRHAQAEHNNYELHDPPLTSLGFGPQCDELAALLQNEKEFPIAQKVELIVVSPMRRTLQTAQQGLGWLMKRGVPVILRPEWQENSAKPCDTGSPIPEMAAEWPQFDWSEVDPTYPAKTGLYEYSKSGLTKRGIAAKKWLRERPEKVIAVVSHSGFLRVGVSQRYYENADFRIFEFGEGKDEIGGELIEWELTENRGGGQGKSERGHFPMKLGDYPAEEEDKVDTGEATSEVPQNSL